MHNLTQCNLSIMIIVLRDLVMIMFMLIMLLITVTIFPRICSFSWSRSHLPLNVVKLGVLLLNLASHAHCHVGQVAQDAGDDSDFVQDNDDAGDDNEMIMACAHRERRFKRKLITIKEKNGKVKRI